MIRIFVTFTVGQSGVFRLFVIALLSITITGSVLAQDAEDYIICFKSGVNIPNSILSKKSDIQLLRPIFKDLNLWQIRIKTSTKKSATLSQLEKSADVRYIHKSLTSYSRLLPNDPDYPSQWSLPRIGMAEVWDITTGGPNAVGHDIVVGILDDGYQIDHVDLAGQIWMNTSEIEGNGIDDDNNGYVDDVYGLNTLTDDDDHLSFRHGTSVAGIIGANGNNENQMAGINWDVKLMLTSSGFDGEYSLPNIVRSYEYLYEQRKRYNETNGAEGAYVVVSNYSGGAPERFPEDFPAWCEVFDQLGSVGIINVGSTSNQNVNVDEDGDLPSTCPSDFLIVATNSGRLDQKIDPAGFGAIGVDLAAPGDDIYTLSVNNGIDQTFFGTSAAAPHIAGVISLMYSIMCKEAYQSSLDNPSDMARVVKSAIMDHVTRSSTLADITVTGGTLNALASIQAIDATIGDCCEINISMLDAFAESCADANDGLLSVVAEGQDLTGMLFFELSGEALNEENALGDFNNLPADEYGLRISDDENILCFIDTSVVIEAQSTPCPFGEFEITELRLDLSSGRLFIDFDLDEQKDIRVQIHDSTGKLIYSQFVRPSLMEGRSHEVTTSDFPAGIYHASILANGVRDVSSFLVAR